MSLPDLSSTAHVPLPGHDMTIKEMYNIAMRNNTVWGIEGYQVPRAYHDAKLMGEISKGNLKKAAPRALKTIDYLADHMKAVKGVPAPNHYEIMKPWVDEKNKPKAKHVTKKNTFIDSIIRESTLKPTPGPGAHNIRETDEQLKKRLEKHKEPKGSERTNFLCEVECLATTVPGPGNYNPRQIQAKIKENRMKPEDWKKKHGEESKKKKSSFPDMGTYTSHPVNYRTFGKDFELRKEKKEQKNVKIWGTSTRFVTRKDPKKDPNNFPGPGNYPMIATWNGKTANGKREKDKNYMNRFTKGIEKSIYYS
jgi:hypothetical protein